MTITEENLLMKALITHKSYLLKEAELTISEDRAKRLKAEARASQAIISKIENGDFE